MKYIILLTGKLLESLLAGSYEAESINKTTLEFTELSCKINHILHYIT